MATEKENNSTGGGRALPPPHPLLQKSLDTTLGYVVLSNLDFGNPLPQAIAHRIMDAYLAPDTDREWMTLFREWEEDWLRSAREELAEIESVRIEGTVPARPLGEYAGTYRDDFLGDVVVRNGSGGLVLQFAGAVRAEMEHWHHETFRATWDDIMLEIYASMFPNARKFVIFRLGHDGKVRALEWEGPDGPVEFERVEANDAANPDE